MSLRALFFLVPPPGFEPMSEGGQTSDTPGTGRSQSEETERVTTSQGEHSGDSAGHPEDVPASAACCTCVAQPDLHAVAEAWPHLPEAVKAGIAAMVRAAAE